MFFPEQMQILMCKDPVDMRKGYGGLEGLVRDYLGEQPLSGKLFLFRGKRGDTIKIFYWYQGGFAIWSKRLQRGSFGFPKEFASKGSSVTITKAALRMILEGSAVEPTVWGERIKSVCV
jgi:transposase